MGKKAIDPEIQDIIKASVDQAIRESIEAINKRNSEEMDMDWFKATERLLYSYPKLKELIEDEQGYIDWNRGRSKDVVKIPDGGTPSTEAVELYVRGRELSFQRTKSDVEWIERALNRISDKDYEIIVKKYFEQKTFEDIAAELEIDESTARRRRSRAVNNLSIYLFGSAAVKI